MTKRMLLLIILIGLLLAACGGGGSDNDNDLPYGKRQTLDESYLSRTIDKELGVACYSQSLNKAGAALFDCVKIDKEDIDD